MQCHGRLPSRASEDIYALMTEEVCMYVCRTTFLRLLTAQLHPISQIHLMYHSLPTSHTCRTTVCRRSKAERTNQGCSGRLLVLPIRVHGMMVLHCHACNVVPCHLITGSRMGPVTIAFFVSAAHHSAGLLPFVGGELMPMHGEVLRVVSRPARTITQRISCMENITKSPHLLANLGSTLR